MIMGGKTSYTTEAIVLRRNDYGDADQIVTFYTREYGKLTGIAKGARRSRKRFANALDIFCCSHLTFSRRSPGTLAFLDDCSVISHFEGVRDSVEKTAAASYLAELIDAFTMEGKPNQDLYALLRGAMALINNREFNEKIVRFVEVRILLTTGYDPVLDHCLRCRYEIKADRTFTFHVREGGLVCNRCEPSGSLSPEVSIGTAKAILMAKRCPLEILPRISLSPQASLEAERFLRRFIAYLLGRELRSRDFLKRLKQFAIDTSGKNK